MKPYLPYAAMLALIPAAAFAQSSTPRQAGGASSGSSVTTNDPAIGQTAAPAASDPAVGAAQPSADVAADAGTPTPDVSASGSTAVDGAAPAPKPAHGKQPHHAQP